MIEQLEKVLEDAVSLQSKLILLIERNNQEGVRLLRLLATRKGIRPLNVGAELGKKIGKIPQRQRHLQTAAALRNLADQNANGNLLLLTNIELLFDRSLQLDPLDLLKRHAHAMRVVAVWPGQLQGDTKTGRLTYAELGHPEHQDYSLAGVVPFEIK